jgi:large subunit ribosomal protein L9
MRIIFLSDVPGSGLAGEVKEVKNGYARNYLIPQNLAVVANHDQLQRIEAIRTAGEVQRLKDQQDMEALAEQLGGLSVSITARVGPSGRLYGAITNAMVAEEIIRLTEREFDRRSIQLEEPIHEPGEYPVEIRLSHGVTASLQVTVLAEGQEAVAAVGEAHVVEGERSADEVIQELEQAEAVSEVTPQAEAVQVEETEETGGEAVVGELEQQEESETETTEEEEKEDA